jgi:ethanolamine utilization protein EutN
MNDEIADCRLQIADWNSTIDLQFGFNLQSAFCNLQSHGRLMQIANVVGSVVSTQKHRKFEGAKLLLVQPLTLDGTPRGAALLAVDSVGAGVREKVLIVLEGRAAGEALGRKAAPVDAAIVGIIDQLECDAG